MPRDEILFIADTGNRKLVEVRVEKADYKMSCHMRTAMKFKDDVNPTGLCATEGQQKFLLADSGTSGGLLVLSLKDGTTVQLLTNESALCRQIHGVALAGESIIFTDTKSHSLKRFRFDTSILDGRRSIPIPMGETIIGNGSSGTDDGDVVVARLCHPTVVVTEYGTTYFVDASSKSVRLVTKISAMVKYIWIMEEIYRAFHIHSSILRHAQLPSLTKAEERLQRAEAMLNQMLENVKAKLNDSGVMQGPQGTLAE